MVVHSKPDVATSVSPKVQLLDLLSSISPYLSVRGRDLLVLCSEIIKHECPLARSGGAAVAAANVLRVPQWKLLGWLRCAEKVFADLNGIRRRNFTNAEAFRDFLVRARAAGMEHLPGVDHDRRLAAEMVAEEERLLVGDSNRETISRPNVHLMELVRLLLLDRPRPQ